MARNVDLRQGSFINRRVRCKIILVGHRTLQWRRQDVFAFNVFHYHELRNGRDLCGYLWQYLRVVVVCKAWRCDKDLWTC